MQQGQAIFIGAAIAIFILILILLIWIFSGNPPKKPVIIITKTMPEEVEDVSTPVLEGDVSKTEEIEDDDIIYSPQSTAILTDGDDMSKYSPIEDVYLTPPVSEN
jgi:hypothetical protein